MSMQETANDLAISWAKTGTIVNTQLYSPFKAAQLYIEHTHTHIHAHTHKWNLTRSNQQHIYKTTQFSTTIEEQAVREAATICPRPLQVDLWPFDLESGVRVTCDVDYLYANFSLPRPLCSRLKLATTQTSDVRQTSDALHRLMHPTLGAGA